jgi:hypothetical protein
MTAASGTSRGPHSITAAKLNKDRNGTMLTRAQVKREGRPRIEDRAKTIEARAPWLKLGMSRRTWYRRQAERREGG